MTNPPVEAFSQAHAVLWQQRSGPPARYRYAVAVRSFRLPDKLLSAI